jgi:hypothetical protein
VNTEAGPRIILRLPERWLTRYTISEEISPKLCGIGLGFGPGFTFAADQNFGAKSAIADGVYTGQPINFRQSLLDCHQTGSYRRQSAERNKNRCCFVSRGAGARLNLRSLFAAACYKDFSKTLAR